MNANTQWEMGEVVRSLQRIETGLSTTNERLTDLQRDIQHGYVSKELFHANNQVLDTKFEDLENRMPARVPVPSWVAMAVSIITVGVLLIKEIA